MASASDLPPSLDATGQIPEQSREDILKQIFGDIGKLIDDFSCAVESTVLLHGRMYITDKYICFYSNLFGLEKKIRIPYSHIKSITKENTAMVIPNAIAISTDKRDYIFRSFWDREECFKTLHSYLERFKGVRARSNTHTDPHPPPGSSPSSSAQHGSSPTPPATTTPPTDANANASVAPTASLSAASVETTNPSEGVNNMDSSRRASRKMSVSTTASSTSVLPEDGFEDSESGFNRDSSRPGSVLLTTADAGITFVQELTKAKLKIQVVNDFIDISLKDFEMLFIGENAPYSFKRYHESVKDTNVVMSNWGEPAPGLGVGREIKFFKPVNLPGLASTRGVKVQRLRKFGSHGLLLYSVTKLEDVPAADAFSVDDVIAASVVSDNRIAVDISFQVTFIKSTYMKYIIERSTNAEMTKWLEVFFQHLKKTSELFVAGKLNLAAPTPEPAPEPEPTPAPSAQQAPKDEAPKSMAATILQFILGFNDQTLGDRIKTLVAIVCIAFLLANAFTWYSTAKKIDQLEKSLEEVSRTLRFLQCSATGGRGDEAQCEDVCMGGRCS